MERLSVYSLTIAESGIADVLRLGKILIKIKESFVLNDNHKQDLKTLLLNGRIEYVERLLQDLESNPEKQWTCTSCTLLNLSSTQKCEICLSARRDDIPADKRTRPQVVSKWNCPVCTSLNPPTATACPRCAFLNQEALPDEGLTTTQLSEEDLANAQNGLWKGSLPLGEGKGVAFRVWAPNATNLCVAGNFNGWSKTRNPLQKEPTGFWSGVIANAKAGDEYKYIITTSKGNTVWRNDPCSRYINPENSNDVIVDPKEYNFQIKEMPSARLNELVMYELHIGTFSPEGTYQGAIKRLQYLRFLGINCLSLMPLSQDSHSCCWGYDPISLYAIHAPYGTPKDLKMFVDAAHEMGFYLVIDWVPNHLCDTNVVRNFDGEEIYLYPDERSESLFGVRLNFSDPNVRDWILGSMLMLTDEYNFDGIRVDSTKTLRKKDGGSCVGADLPESWVLMQAATDAVHAREKFIVAEDLDGDPRMVDTAGFDSQWDDRLFIQLFRFMVTPNDSDRVIGQLANEIQTFYRRSACGRIIYTENHDTVPDNRSKRFPFAIDGGNDFGARRSILAAAIMMSCPGIPLMLQGQESFELRSLSWPDPPVINHEAPTNPKESEVFFAYRHLCYLRRNLLHVSAGLMGDDVRVCHVNERDKVFAMHRSLQEGVERSHTLVIVNATNNTFEAYRIGVPRNQLWFVHFDLFEALPSINGPAIPSSYDQEYQPEAYPYDGFPFSIEIRYLRAYTALIMSNDENHDSKGFLARSRVEFTAMKEGVEPPPILSKQSSLQNIFAAAKQEEQQQQQQQQQQKEENDSNNQNNAMDTSSDQNSAPAGGEENKSSEQTPQATITNNTSDSSQSQSDVRA